MRVFIEQTQAGACRRGALWHGTMEFGEQGRTPNIPQRGDVLDLELTDDLALKRRFRGEVSFLRWTNYAVYVVLFSTPSEPPPPPACVGG